MPPDLIPAGTPDTCRAVLAKALSYRGIEEATGRNDGPQVEQFLPGWARGEGHAWCAFYVCHVLRAEGHDIPHIGSVKRLVDLLPHSTCAFPGCLFAWVNPDGRGHIGFVLAVSEYEHRIGTVEGNADDAVRAQLRDVGSPAAGVRWTFLDPYQHVGIEVDRLAYWPGLPELPEAGRGQGTR